MTTIPQYKYYQTQRTTAFRPTCGAKSKPTARPWATSFLGSPDGGKHGNNHHSPNKTAVARRIPSSGRKGNGGMPNPASTIRAFFEFRRDRPKDDAWSRPPFTSAP